MPPRQVSENEGAFPVSVLKRLNAFLVGNKTPADSYVLVRLWLVRGLGFVYFVACSILFFQGVALWGKDGLLPIGSFADEWSTTLAAAEPRSGACRACSISGTRMA